MSVTKAMTGLSILGSLNPQNVAFVLVGEYDEYLKHAFYFVTYKKAHVGDEPISDPLVLDQLEHVKDQLRRGIQQLFEEDARQSFANLRAKLNETNKPHELGTVAEIAAKFNISKSEVRRRKADGTLSELINKELV